MLLKEAKALVLHFNWIPGQYPPNLIQDMPTLNLTITLSIKRSMKNMSIFDNLIQSLEPSFEINAPIQKKKDVNEISRYKLKGNVI